MAQKYKFDPQSLIFQEESKTSKLIKTIFAHIIAIILLGIVFFLIFSSFITSEQQREIYLENKRLRQEYTKILNKYNLIRNEYERLQHYDELIYQSIYQTLPPEKIYPDYTAIVQKIGLKHFVKNMLRQEDSLISIIRQDNSHFPKLLEYAKKKNHEIQNIPSVLPLPIEFLKAGVYGYGYKIDPFYKTLKKHFGVDFSAPENTPVFATADGSVIALPKYDKEDRQVFGNYVFIDHQNGFYTLYANMALKTVSTGQFVKKGQLIGYVGNSGKSFIPHLHYEVRFKNKRLDPIYFFFQSVPYILFKKIYYDSRQRGISLD